MLSNAAPLRLLPSAIGALALLAALKTTALLQAAPAAAELAAGLRATLGRAVAARPAVITELRAEEPGPVPVPVAPPPSARELATPAPAPAVAASVVADLQARRQALAETERRLSEREALLQAAERRLAARAEELAALQAALETQAMAVRERDAAAWRSLVRVYEAMRPRDAAAIFDELDMAVLVEVVDRMREVRAAPILAGMHPEKARALTQELARRRNTMRSVDR